jgi:predicted dehydrogenase
MKKIRILIIGAGLYVSGKGTNGFGTIMPAIMQGKKNGYVSDIAICSTSSRSIKEVKSKFTQLSKIMAVSANCNYFPNNKSKNHIDAIREFQPDAVIISVPDHLHYKISMDVLKLKKHILLVKPMTNKTIFAKKMTTAAKKAKVIAQVEFHKRLDESNIILKDKIESDQLGDILYSTIEYSQQKQIPETFFKKWSKDTNVFNYLGVHYVDLLLFLTNYKPKTVTAWGQKNYLLKKGINTWDSIQVVIEWSLNNRAFVSNHITNWIDPNKSSAMSDQRINIVGTKGRYLADQKNRGIEMVSDENGSIKINPYFSQMYGSRKKSNITFDGYGIKNILQFCDDVISFENGIISLKTLENSRASFKSSTVSTAVIEGVEKSLRNKNMKVKISL